MAKKEEEKKTFWLSISSENRVFACPPTHHHYNEPSGICIENGNIYLDPLSLEKYQTNGCVICSTSLVTTMRYFFVKTLYCPIFHFV